MFIGQLNQNVLDFLNLVLKKELQDKVNKIIKDNYKDKYIACHIRKTDHIKSFRKR